MANKKNSPFKLLPAAALAIGAGISAIGGIAGAISAGKAKREAERKERKARAEMNRLKGIYANLDTSNPFLNMENTMEDLTINQKAADFQKQTFSQSQANILGGLRGAAGSSGIAALAQTLAQQGQLASQKAAADIGAQEARNQQLERQEAGRIQQLERQGEMQSRQMELNKQSTLLGMSQQETAAYMQQAQAANQAKWQAISGTVSNITSMIPGLAKAPTG
tara:strand:- start:4172 stop:4837 length:666 start_codon:yes stop_codon:yes gene_type:complete